MLCLCHQVCWLRRYRERSRFLRCNRNQLSEAPFAFPAASPLLGECARVWCCSWRHSCSTFPWQLFPPPRVCERVPPLIAVSGLLRSLLRQSAELSPPLSRFCTPSDHVALASLHRRGRLLHAHTGGERLQAADGREKHAEQQRRQGTTSRNHNCYTRVSASTVWTHRSTSPAASSSARPCLSQHRTCIDDCIDSTRHRGYCDGSDARLAVHSRAHRCKLPRGRQCFQQPRSDPLSLLRRSRSIRS